MAKAEKTPLTIEISVEGADEALAKLNVLRDLLGQLSAEMRVLRDRANEATAAIAKAQAAHVPADTAEEAQ